MSKHPLDQGISQLTQSQDTYYNNLAKRARMASNMDIDGQQGPVYPWDGRSAWTPGSAMAPSGFSMMRPPRFPSKYFGYRAVPRSHKTFEMYGPSWKYASPAQRENRWNNSYVGQGRYKRKYRGRGLYTGAGSYFSRMMGRQLNRTLAGKTPLGHAAKQVGRAALQRGTNMALSAIGQGSYKVAGTKGNHLIEGMGSGTPSFQSAGDETGALTVQHTEYIKDIYGIEFTGDPATPTTNMSSDIVIINPGKAESFPWLSQIAANYEEYEIKQLMYCYKSKVSDNLTSSDGQVGSIIMFTEYNANDAMKKTKQQLLQAYGTTNALINTNDVLHGVECDVSKLKGDGHKYIRTENIPSTTDKSDYDWAKLQVAVVDTPEQLSNQVVGELYVSYTVVLRKPRLFSTLALNLQEDQFYLKTTDNFYSSNAEFGQAETNSIGCMLKRIAHASNTTTHSITFPANFSGDVELLFSWDSATPANSWFKLPKYVSGAWVAYNTGATGNITATGNVEGVENLPVTAQTADPEDASMIDQNNTATMAIMHLRVAQASMGVDNRIDFGIDTGGIATQLHIKISRYNGHESDAAPVFKQIDYITGKLNPNDLPVTITD